MTSTLLLAYFLHQFAVGAPSPPTYRELRRMESPGILTVGVTPVAGGSVPAGAQRVPVLDLTFTASCNADIPVWRLTLQRRGMGDYRDIKAVYAMEGLKRISRAHQLTRRDGIVTVRTRPLIIPACRTRNVSIFADFSADASVAGEHRFVLEGNSDVKARAANIRLRQHPERRLGESTRTVAADVLGKVSVTYLRLLRRVTYGSRRQVMRFVLEANGVDDHLIHAITLTNEGSARDLDLHNLFLPGTKVASSLDGDQVRLVFEPPLSLKKNQQRLMTLRADVRASRRRTIRFIIEEPGDVESTVVRGRGG